MVKDRSEVEKVLYKHEKKLMDYPNVINVFVGDKFVNDKDTGDICIAIYVTKKLPKSSLKPEEVIPSTIDDVCTDVIELKPDTWEAGKTEPSQLPYDVKKRIGGGVID